MIFKGFGTLKFVTDPGTPKRIVLCNQIACQRLLKFSHGTGCATYNDRHTWSSWVFDYNF